jgi:alpha-N-arabinofuranosidase
MASFRNPILSGFYPDPSICRVDNDFYLVNSTFAYFPGIPIFHSRDLCRWKQIGNAIDRPGQLCYDGHQISEGLFAPTIRHNRGTFYILCTLIRTGGNFIITAKDPAGPWSDPVWLTGADGIDPSIFFDDDGTTWYTGTHPAPEGEAYPGDCEIYIQQMNLALLETGKNPLIGKNLGIWRGALRGAAWPEGPHIYRINGWYYLLYAEGGTGLDHAVCVARARDIRGPWEGKKSNPVLTHRHLGKKAAIINAGHADLFDDPTGNWWMALLASRPVNGVCPLGRETFMVPVFWEDGWPFVASKTGLIEETFPLPDADTAPSSPEAAETACDHFDGKLPLHWLMLRMPAREQDSAVSLTARPGAVRLFTRAPTMRDREHPAFAGRRLEHHHWTFSAAIEFTPRTAGEAAGIILLQSEDWQYRFELFLADSGRPALRLIRAAGKEDEVIAVGESPIAANSPQNAIILAARCEETAISFWYGKDQNTALKPFAGPVDGRILSTEYSGGFVGTLAGVFASGNGSDTGNYADVFWAEYIRP